MKFDTNLSKTSNRFAHQKERHDEREHHTELDADHHCHDKRKLCETSIGHLSRFENVCQKRYHEKDDRRIRLQSPQKHDVVKLLLITVTVKRSNNRQSFVRSCRCRFKSQTKTRYMSISWCTSKRPIAATQMIAEPTTFGMYANTFIAIKERRDDDGENGRFGR